MKQKTAVIISSGESLDFSYSPSHMRLKTIEGILSKANYSYTTHSVKYFLKNVNQLQADLGVIVSFTNSWVAPLLKQFTKRIWLDAMDSKSTLEITQSRTYIKQKIANVRDSFGTKYLYDLVTFISDEDRKNEQGVYKSSSEYVFPIKIEELPSLNITSTRSFVFVGPSRYKPNLDAVSLIDTMMKENQIEIPVKICGAGYSEKKYKWHELLHFNGFVDEKELYYSSDVHLAPLRSGAGIKMKSVIPLALGLQVIGTKISFNGLQQHSNLIELENVQQLPEYMKTIDFFPKVKAPTSKNIYVCDESNELGSELLNF